MSLSRPVKFPFLKLPWLCIKCVIHDLDLFDIIYFATISNRTRRIVQLSKYPVKKIDVYPNGHIKIHTGDTQEKLDDRRTWYFIHDKYVVGKPLVLKRNSPSFPTRSNFDPIKGHFHYSYTVGDTLDALKMGIDFLIDVFGCKIGQLYVHNDKLPELVRLDISSVEELFLSNIYYITDLEYLLENIKVTDKYQFYAPLPKDFYCDPQTFKCRQLFFGGVNSADWVTLQLLCQFDVPQLAFRFHRFSFGDIVSYITNWYNSENKKLEYLHVVFFNDPVTLEGFKIDHLNPMPFCENRRNRYPFVEGWTNTDISSEMDILRKDGLLATFFVKPTSVLFYIWHDRFPDAI